MYLVISREAARRVDGGWGPMGFANLLWALRRNGCYDSALFDEVRWKGGGGGDDVEVAC